MKTSAQFIASSNLLKAWLAPAQSPWHASREVVSQVVEDTGYAAEAVLAVAWHEAPEKEFKRVSLPIVLVADGREGKLARLTLDLLESAEPQAPTGFLAAWDMQAVPTDDGFREGFSAARKAINKLDPEHPLWPDNASWLVRWNLPQSKPLSLEGKSLGGAIALGLLALLNLAGKVPVSHRHAHKLLALTAEQVRERPITAEISKDGHFEAIKGLKHKVQAANSGKVKALFTGGVQRLAAASGSAEPIHVSDLLELLGFLRELHERSIAVPKKKALKKWALAAALISLLAFIANELSFMYPTKWVLERRLPREVRVEDTPSETYSHVIQVAAIPSDLNEKDWSQEIVPVLKHYQWPLSLIIGSPGSLTRQPNAVTLGDFDELSCIRSLSLMHSGFERADGLGKLRGLKTFVSLGSRVTNLEGIANAKELKTLILDSGFIVAYPEWDFPHLETLILRVPDTEISLDLSKCPKLRKLAICGNGIRQIHGLENLKYLEKLAICSEAFAPFSLMSVKAGYITHLELSRLKSPFGLRLSAIFPNLRSLVLNGTSIGRLEGLAECSELHSIDISQSPALEVIDLKGASSLQSLSVTHSALAKIEQLGDATSVSHLSITNCPLMEMHGMQRMCALRVVDLSGTKIAKLPTLEDLHELESLDLDETKLKVLPILGAQANCEASSYDTPLEDAEGGQNSWQWFPSEKMSSDHKAGEWRSSGLVTSVAGGGNVDRGPIGGDYSYTPDYSYYNDGAKAENSRILRDGDGWQIRPSSPTVKEFNSAVFISEWGLAPAVGYEIVFSYTITPLGITDYYPSSNYIRADRAAESGIFPISKP